jgi:hypothetical protein
MRFVLHIPMLAGMFFLLARCSVPPPSPGSTVPGKAPEASPDPKATKLTTTSSAKVDMDEIFPAGKGRDLVLNNCTSCHTIVPIVVLQMTRDAWERNSRDHRGRVTALSDAEFKTLYEYLIANFNPQRPVPKLPKALLDTWTAY